MKLNCLIVDDEPIAVEILEDYIHMVADFNLVGKCASAIEAVNILQEKKVDLLFLDIQMPKISGISFLKSLKKTPAVIFTTAYPNYAIEGFELEAIDYLLKPISVERFFKAVNRILNRWNEITPGKNVDQQPKQTGFFFIKSNQDFIKLEYQDILYIEALENYVRIYCSNKTIISISTLKNMEEILSPYDFLRVHKSYIVNLKKVDSVQNNICMINNMEIAIGRNYRKTVTEIIKAFYSG
jgi:DNA-binding LytR/AlgR family response regulator